MIPPHGLGRSSYLRGFQDVALVTSVTKRDVTTRQAAQCELDHRNNKPRWCRTPSEGPTERHRGPSDSLVAASVSSRPAFSFTCVITLLII
ncbi:hypothetical protein F2P81_005183 [Scophthalmus maximus]|uniref:Uncharacterized protein n=1 Tax=Scophthalmus maximus TaxID=52904 RepID=A0A6A4TFL6_SCOMX|nr:hypothetical protein F2P81_005183 [Scophthalmus maximus]